MQIRLLCFGGLTDVVGSEADFTDVKHAQIQVGALKDSLERLYPGLLGKTYRLALNQQFVQDDVWVLNGDEVALMPPFSGG